MAKESVPYHFVPVDPKLTILDTPVFHDIQTDGPDSWSGEIDCTMTALTPLICGHFQYSFKELPKEVKNSLKKQLQITFEDEKKVLEPLMLPSENNPHEPGRVVIPGSSIKGMIRNSLQALLSAPMERVNERRFTFRPNLKDSVNMRPAVVSGVTKLSDGTADISITQGSDINELIFISPESYPVFENWLKTALLVPKDFSFKHTENIPLNKIPPVTTIPSGSRINDVRIEKQFFQNGGRKNKLVLGDDWRLSQDYCLARYHGGLTGDGTLASFFKLQQDRKFNSKAMRVNPNTLGYRWVLFPCKSTSFPISSKKALWQEFQETLKILKCEEFGHLKDHPLLEKSQIDEVENRLNEFIDSFPRVGDFLLLERDPKTGLLIGIGHHFRFRRKYRDSIHKTPDCQNNVFPRKILSTFPEEQQINKNIPSAPDQLTCARNLFGYVSEKEKYSPKEPTSYGIGSKDFTQLAGRISVNFAVEEIFNERSRFISSETDGFVPLRPLGSPKASAVEHYLSQEKLPLRADKGILCTYGDSPDDSSAGELRGRKFFLHQPKAASEEDCYNLLKVSKKESNDEIKKHQDEIDQLHKKQAGLARYISKPGTTFRFKLKFRDLRGWELGALIFSLFPNEVLLSSLIKNMNISLENQAPGLNKWHELIANKFHADADTDTDTDTNPNPNPNPDPDPSKRKPLFAHKIGHGRSLGLGSISIIPEKIKRLAFDKDCIPSLQEILEEAKKALHDDRNRALDCMPNLPEILKKDFEAVIMKAFADKLDKSLGLEKVNWVEKILLPWLQVHRYAGRSRFDYPSKKITRRVHGNQVQEYHIYSYHTDLRASHSERRKQEKRNENGIEFGMKELNDLDKSEN
ncbi:MAG: TIGR03986 family CRISPR-associated RAMP protein [Candidatus Riflebacteria bacterium]|nr:TIGR03986 family CRISPR-associated RAMP protein [Candidatus Riflebacteria bacterium]